MRNSRPAALRIDCVLGRCDSMRAEVYVRTDLPGGRIAGTLSGPDCRRAATLPITARIQPLPEAAAGGIAMGRVILTEPAFWTPELPNLYRLEASVAVDAAEVASTTEQVGLRRLGVRGRSLWLDGRRFVPRGLCASAGKIDLEASRQAGVALVMTEPDEDLLARCDAEGLAVIAWLGGAESRVASIPTSITSLARHPSVLVAILPATLTAEQLAPILAATSHARGTLQIAQAVDGTAAPARPPDGIDLLAVTLPAGSLPHPSWRAGPPSLPLLACRTWIDDGATVSRQPCDELQRDLAAWATADGHQPAFDWAGFLACRQDAIGHRD